MGFITNIRNKFFNNKDKQHYLSGFKETSRSFNEKMRLLAEGFTECNKAFYEALMIILIQSDVGVNTSELIVNNLKSKIKDKKTPFDDVVENLYESMAEVYGKQGNEFNYDFKPTVIFVVGVNGSGKTTSIAKLAYYFKQQGKKVAVVAADTFRAGAIDQLAKWAERLDIACILGKQQRDPAAVIVDGCRYANENDIDILLCDTAGRLQNKTNLMNELAKMIKVAKREIEDAPHHVWLTIDASTGQNGLSQARIFTEVTNVSGIILTKMDGTAKGGIILSIKNELNIPVSFVGFGEKVDDLKEFELDSYIYSIANGIKDVG